MPTIHALVFLSSGLFTVAEPTLASRLADQVVAEKLQVIGVWPALLSSSPGTISPAQDSHARLLAESLTEALASRASKSGFSVVSAQMMKEAFPDPSDVGPNSGISDAAKLAAKRLGLQGIVFASLVDHRHAPDEKGFIGLAIVARLYLISTNKLIEVGSDEIEMTLGDAGYLGESWELRRWTEGELRDVGFESHLLATSAFGVGPLHEQIQYQAIRRGGPHPLEDAMCPFRIRILVQAKERELLLTPEKCYTGLDPGDVYVVEVHNQSPKDVYLLLYVDGVNVLEKKAEFPSETPTHRHWFMKAGGRFHINGWTTRTADGQFNSQRFIVTNRSLSVAGKQEAVQRMGTISALFYTAGLESIPEVELDRDILRRGSIATGAGMSQRIRLELANGKSAPGILLAAITIDYLTTEQFQRMASTHGK